MIHLAYNASPTPNAFYRMIHARDTPRAGGKTAEEEYKGRNKYDRTVNTRSLALYAVHQDPLVISFSAESIKALVTVRFPDATSLLIAFVRRNLLSLIGAIHKEFFTAFYMPVISSYELPSGYIYPSLFNFFLFARFCIFVSSAKDKFSWILAAFDSQSQILKGYWTIPRTRCSASTWRSFHLVKYYLFHSSIKPTAWRIVIHAISNATVTATCACNYEGVKKRVSLRPRDKASPSKVQHAQW